MVSGISFLVSGLGGLYAGNKLSSSVARKLYTENRQGYISNYTGTLLNHPITFSTQRSLSPTQKKVYALALVGLGALTGLAAAFVLSSVCCILLTGSLKLSLFSLFLGALGGALAGYNKLPNLSVNYPGDSHDSFIATIQRQQQDLQTRRDQLQQSALQAQRELAAAVPVLPPTLEEVQAMGARALEDMAVALRAREQAREQALAERAQALADSVRNDDASETAELWKQCVGRYRSLILEANAQFEKSGQLLPAFTILRHIYARLFSLHRTLVIDGTIKVLFTRLLALSNSSTSEECQAISQELTVELDAQSAASAQ